MREERENPLYRDRLFLMTLEDQMEHRAPHNDPPQPSADEPLATAAGTATYLTSADVAELAAAATGAASSTAWAPSLSALEQKAHAEFEKRMEFKQQLARARRNDKAWRKAARSVTK